MLKAANNEMSTMAATKPLAAPPNVFTTLETATGMHPRTQKTARKTVHTTISLTGYAMTNAMLKHVTTTRETAIYVLIGLLSLMNATIIVTVRVTFLSAIEMTEAAICVITTALIHTWVITFVAKLSMWNPTTEIMATAILTTEKTKNLFYVAPAAMIIASEMDFVTTLVTPGIATMMMETAVKKIILNKLHQQLH